MTVIVRRVLDDVRAHARESAPRECCGVLLGTTDRIVDSMRATNLAPGNTRFELDPRDHFRAIREARSRQLDVVGFYHSHPHTPAYPSPTDMAESGYADALHLIAGIREGVNEIRLFRIRPDAVSEVLFDVDDDARQQR